MISVKHLLQAARTGAKGQPAMQSLIEAVSKIADLVPKLQRDTEIDFGDNEFEVSDIRPLLGEGLTVDKGKVVATNRDLKNADFEYQLKDWDKSSGWSADGTDKYSGAYSAVGVGSGAAEFLLQSVAVLPGDIILFTAFARESLDGTSRIVVNFYDSAQTFLSGASTNISGDSWVRYGVLTQAPANSAYAKVGFEILADSTTGRLAVDQCKLEFLEATQGAVSRSISGITLNVNATEFTVVNGQLTINGVPLNKALAGTYNAAEFTISGGVFVQAGVDFRKAIVGSYEGSEFEITGNAFRVKNLQANKINAGILSVGGPGMVSKFAVFDTVGNAIGWIGDDSGNSGYVGAWFKRVLIGGASPSQAKIAAGSDGSVSIIGNGSSSGGVTISNAPISLTFNGVTTEINNLSVNLGSPGTRTVALKATETATGKLVAVAHDLVYVKNGGNDILIEPGGLAGQNSSGNFSLYGNGLLLEGPSVIGYQLLSGLSGLYGLYYSDPNLSDFTAVISGKSWGGNTIPVTKGGTGATDASTARSNLGLGNAATKDVGTTVGTVAAGNHDHTGVYATVSHSHSISDVTSLQTELDDRGSYYTSDPGSSLNDGAFAFWWDGSSMWLVFKKDGNKFRVQLSSY